MALDQFRFVTEKQVVTAMATAKPQPPESWLNVWIPLIENEVERFLGRILDYGTGIVEWFDPSDDQFILLDRRPVHRVSEIRYDSRGGYGQIPNTFGTETILAPGTDWYLQIDGRGPTEGSSDTGIVWRRGQTWGATQQWQRDFLLPAKERQQGAIKVVYDGGYKLSSDPKQNQIPGAVAGAVTQAAGVWFDTMVKVGVTSGENVSGYGWQQVLGMNLGENQFASVRQMLTTLRNFRPGAGYNPR